MFCPNCGAKNSSDQSFCRSCGLNLEQTARSLLEQIPPETKEVSRAGEQTLEKLGKIAFGGMGIVGLAAVGGLIYTIFNKFILSGSGIITGVIFILLLIFAVLGLAYVIFNESLKEKKRFLKSTQAEPAGGTANLLEEKPFEPVPTVTEDTTDLLYVKNKTRELK